MVELWFAICALVLTVYVVLDGFDFGAGVLHLFVARTGDERRHVLAAIGPYWNGNEVWLVASGGALFLAFPKVLAAGLSGFYLTIFFVLWALILRGMAIEFRSHIGDALVREACDIVFAGASALLAIMLGAAIGNVIRGVPLEASGYFELTLFTDFSAQGQVGILDWYTILTAVFSLVALALHGALFLAWKTEGPVHERSRKLAGWLFAAVVALWVGVTAATYHVSPWLLGVLPARPLAIGLAVAAAGGAGAVLVGLRGGHLLVAFLGSCAFLGGLLGATAACLFPVMLRATGGDALSLTAYGSSADPAGLRTAMAWWSIGFPLAIGYFVLLFRLHRGKTKTAADPYGT